MRKVLNGVLSMPVRVHGDVTIGQDGQPTMGYTLGHLAPPILLPRYYKYFNSFGDVSRPSLERIPWDDKAPENLAGVAGASSLAPND